MNLPNFSTAMISKRFFFGLALGLALLSPTSGRAQMGNDNPTGVSGSYNGNVTTGGSYDPYTGNATRSVTDLVVAGGVGKYPLAFTRTMNTRYAPGAGTLEFGPSGTWRHNYQWTIDSFSFQSNAPDKWYAMPLVYTVNYPDGRRLSFFNSATDSMMRAGSGVSDRFQKPAGTEGGDCYLLLPDGGKAWFTMSVERWGDDFGPVTSTFDFSFNGIIDPHGQVTTVGYVANGSLQITEPAGRWLQLFYVTAPWNGDILLDRVVASDGRSVKYNYGPYQPAGATTYSYLGNVQYLDNNGASYTQAIYWYQPGNTDPNGRPLISACIDPMYTGPMWAIGYTFVPGSSGGVYGQLAHEHYFNPANGQTGGPVSSLTANGNSRTETRGDIPIYGGVVPARTFNYSGGKLVNFTDYKGQTSYISYDGNGYVGSVMDARGHTTTMIREGIIGALSQFKHHDQSYVGFAYWNTNGGPYHLQIRGDERGKNTYFTRDANFRLTRIDYPDYPNGAYETFAYNSRDQVTSHRMTTGGVVNFTYAPNGLLSYSTGPAGTTNFYYDGHHRLAQVRNPRGHNIWFQYNTRGQVTRVTHHDGQFVQIGYDNHGNKISVTNELNLTTNYYYDDYNRLLQVMNPLGENQWLGYEPYGGGGRYSHTSASAYWHILPSGKQTHFGFDENLRPWFTRQAPGVPGEDAFSINGYDAAGNLISAQDFRGHVTTFGYDSRNRRTSATNALSETTSWQYDATSNLIRETRPDQSYRRLEYDSMNRVIDAYGFANERTQFIRNLAGRVTQMIDAKNASYGFGYDNLGRQTSATYPVDATGYARTENFWYDGANNLIQYKNPNNQYQYLAYDSRNRRTGSSWSYGGPAITTTYDFASRVTSVVTRSSPTGSVETTVAFGYDNANRKIWEDQTLAGYLTRRLETTRDLDGNRTRLHSPEGHLTTNYDYNQRNQLFHMRGDDPFATYTWDAAGNITQVLLDWANGSPTNYTYDQLNRVTAIDHGNPTHIFQHNDYKYDNLGREVATWREEQANKGEHFGYDAIGQLTSVAYNADQVWTGNPLNATHTTSYTLNPLNRLSVTANGTATGYTANGLNQYTAVDGLGLGYDGNFNLTGYNGAGFSYNAAGQLTTASKGGNTVQFTYDGLGRCVRRTVNGTARLFTYDGWNPVLEWDGAGNWQAVNVYGPRLDEILVRVDATYGPMSYKQDRRGDVTFLLDGSRQIVEKYTYDAFGKPTIMDANGNVRTESAYGNRFMFTGREYIKELGIYDFRLRHYQPEHGRFLQRDPIGFAAGDANVFRYCGGDPVNCVDPFGLAGKKEKTYNTENKGGGESQAQKEWGDRNFNMGSSNSAGFSTQGFWSTPEGFPTGLTSITGLGSAGSGPDSTNQGGNRSSLSVGLITYTTVRVIVTPSGSFLVPVNPAADNFGFRSGEVSQGRTIPNPYLNSAPFIAVYGKGFDGPGLRRTAAAFETYALGVSAVVAAPVAGSLALDAVYAAGYYGIPAAQAAYMTFVNDPNRVNTVQRFVAGFTSPGWDYGSRAGFVGSASNATVNAALTFADRPEIGP